MSATRMNWSAPWRDIHPVPQLNYQLNRWLPVADADRWIETAARIVTLDDWKNEMLLGASAAERAGRALHASTCYRAAEFFMAVGDRDKSAAYERYRELFYLAAADIEFEMCDVSFCDAKLPVLRFPARGERRDTIVLHGGFDSYMEEFVSWGPLFAERGYEFVVFEGPGQGAALRHHGLTMTPRWEEPVRAALDSLCIESCTLIGLSLGGYLAPRAAAYEPRIQRVVVINVLFDFFDCLASKLPATVAEKWVQLDDRDDTDALNAEVVAHLASHPEASWPINHGMHISGSPDPARFIRWLRQMNTRTLSGLVTQDCLITAGTADHIVPLPQFFRQAESLTAARSLTARLFTSAEGGQHHCQVGNIELLLDVVFSWLDVQRRAAR